MKRVWLSVAAVLAVAVIGASLAGAAPAAQGTTIATFSDTVGEQAGAPDISTVTVSLDGAVLTVEAQVAGMPFMSEGALMFLLNTDNNRATGEYMGADYVIITDMGTLEGAALRWNGSDYVAAEKVADPSRTLIGSGTAGFMFNLANLGSPTHIEFSMTVIKGATESGLIDIAPDSGLWAFDAVVPTPAPTPTPTPAPAPAVAKPVFGSIKTAPAQPVAGKKFAFTLAVNRSDTGAPLTQGTMVCDPSVAGKVITHAESFTNGKAKLAFVVPKTAKGKLLKVKVKIVNGTKSATKVTTYKVR
jgi:hypothetical protein